MTTPNQIIEKLESELETDPDLKSKFQQDPATALKQFRQENQENPLQTDKVIYRIIVVSLGLTVLLIILGVIVLLAIGKISNDQGVPTILTAIGSAAIGALAGLLAPPPTKET